METVLSYLEYSPLKALCCLLMLALGAVWRLWRIDVKKKDEQDEKNFGMLVQMNVYLQENVSEKKILTNQGKALEDEIKDLRQLINDKL